MSNEPLRIALKIALKIVSLAENIQSRTAQIQGSVVFENYDLERAIGLIQEKDDTRALYRFDPLKSNPKPEEAVAFAIVLGENAPKLPTVCKANKKVLRYLLAHAWERMTETSLDPNGIDYDDFHTIRERLGLKPYSAKLFDLLNISEEKFRAIDVPHALASLLENLEYSSQMMDKLETFSSEADTPHNLASDTDSLRKEFVRTAAENEEYSNVLAVIKAQKEKFALILEQSVLTSADLMAYLKELETNEQGAPCDSLTRTLN
jgi:hypothetical protein